MSTEHRSPAAHRSDVRQARRPAARRRRTPGRGRAARHDRGRLLICVVAADQRRARRRAPAALGRAGVADQDRDAQGVADLRAAERRAAAHDHDQLDTSRPPAASATRPPTRAPRCRCAATSRWTSSRRSPSAPAASCCAWRWATATTRSPPYLERRLSSLVLRWARSSVTCLRRRLLLDRRGLRAIAFASKQQSWTRLASSAPGILRVWLPGRLRRARTT